MDNVTFGIDTQIDILELTKALSVGHDPNPATMTGFAATQHEFLESTLKYAIAEEKSVKFIKSLPKKKAGSTMVQFTTVNAIGRASFYTEGGSPVEYNEDIKRELENIKYLGALAGVPIPATLVNAQTSNQGLIQKLKAIAILREANLKAFFGNENFVAEEFNGFYTQFLKRVKKPSQNIINAKGKCLTPELLNQVSQIVQGNFGDPTNIKGWISNTAFSNYANHLIKNKTFMVGVGEIRSIVDVPKTYKIADGEGALETDIWLRFRGQTNIDELHPKLTANLAAFAATHKQAPNQLSAQTCSASIDDLAGSELPADTYDYAIIPVNKYGAGLAFEITNQQVAANKKVTFTVTDNGSMPGEEATCYEIYRKAHTGTTLVDYRYEKTVKIGDVTNNVDDGQDIPGTEIGFFWDWNTDQVLNFFQLLPMVRMDLARTRDSIQWMQKWYTTPILFNPNKMVVIKNLGSLAWT